MRKKFKLFFSSRNINPKEVLNIRINTKKEQSLVMLINRRFSLNDKKIKKAEGKGLFNFRNFHSLISVELIKSFYICFFIYLEK